MKRPLLIGVHISVLLLFVLSGCAPKVWYKPHATVSDLDKDEYECLQQAQRESGEPAVHYHGGFAKERVITNWDVFQSCMTAKGWSLHDRDALQDLFAQSTEEFQQAQSVLPAALKAFDDKKRVLCSQPEFAALFAKTPCQVKEITFQLMADGSSITQDQRPLLIRYRTEMEALYKALANELRAHGTDIDAQYANYIVSLQGDVDNVYLDLLNGKITWGEFNQRRKELAAKLEVGRENLYHPTP
ncbi:MAG TPA: hypothetical protein VLY45_02795 [Nitrospiria bacterium]|nr:hypothetical protein [Nitrospiria bacterium]